MKKVLCILMVLLIPLSSVACNKNPPSSPVASKGKVAIITNTVSQNEEEYRYA